MGRRLRVRDIPFLCRCEDFCKGTLPVKVKQESLVHRAEEQRWAANFSSRRVITRLYIALTCPS